MPIHIRRLLIRPTLHPIRPSMVRPPELTVQARDTFLCGLLAINHDYTQNPRARPEACSWCKRLTEV